MFRRALRDAVARRYLTTNPAAIAQPRREAATQDVEPRTARRVPATCTLRTALRDVATFRHHRHAPFRSSRSTPRGPRHRRRHTEPRHHHVIAAGRTQISSGKTRRSRRLISLDAATLAALRGHLATLDEEQTAWGPNYQDNGLLFCWPDGRGGICPPLRGRPDPGQQRRNPPPPFLPRWPRTPHAKVVLRRPASSPQPSTSRVNP
jgi:hypothetical protein